MKASVSSLINSSRVKGAVGASDGPAGGVREIAGGGTYYTLAPPKSTSNISRCYSVYLVSGVGATVESK